MTSALVIRGDARHLPLRDESVHLIVTSPPYNARIGYDVYEDWLPWTDYWDGLIAAAMQECYRVLAHGGRLCLNMANVVRQDVPQPGRAARPTQYQGRPGKTRPAGAGGNSWAVILAPRIWSLLEGIGFLPREHLTWVKGANDGEITTNSTAWGTFASARNPVLRATAEPLFIVSKGTHSREPGESDLTSDEFKAWTRNAWFIPATQHGQTPCHPAMFPAELPRRLIKLYSYVGDTVLDPFAGSGTTLRAAKDLGRHAISVDISARYCRMAAARSAQGVLPLGAPCA